MRTDRLLHITLMAGAARVLLCDATETAETSRVIHKASRVCSAALGRGLAGAALLNAPRKGERLTLTFRGDGPAGAMTIVTATGVLKASIEHPLIELPPKPNGKLDVGGAIGRAGRVIVVRDLGIKQPYIGQSSMVSGEIAEDLAMYCTVSEQQPTLCALGVKVGEGGIAAAGGMIIQPLPGCPDELIAKLELRQELYADISAAIECDPLEEIARGYFDGIDYAILHEEPLAYHCDCSRERMEKALIALGRDEMESLIDEQSGAELSCHFCGSTHRFSNERLAELLALAE